MPVALGVAVGCALLGALIGWLAGMVTRNRIKTAQEQAIAALHSSESRYQALIEALPDLIMRMTEEGSYLDFFSTKAFQVLGGHDLVGQNIYEGSLPHDLAEIRMQYVQQALRTGELQVYEQQILVNGEMRIEEVRIAVCRENEVLVVVRDMTDRHQVKIALWESQQLLQQILDSVPQSIFWKDRDSVYLGCNQNFVRDSGLTVTSEIVGKTDYELPWTREEADWYRQCDRQVIDLNTSKLHIQETLTRADGKQIWIETSKVPLQDPAGRMAGILGTYEDITERKQIEQHLQQFNAVLEQQIQERTAELKQALDFEATLKRITDAVRDSLDENRILQTAVDELGQSLGVDLCNTVMYGSGLRSLTMLDVVVKAEYAATQPQYENILDFHPYSTVYHQVLQGILTQFCTHLPDRFEHWVTVLLSPIMDEQGVIGDLLLLRQQSDPFNPGEVRLVQQVANQCAIALRQSQLYQAAQMQVLELERLNRLKNDFLSTISHELRTPMANIKMATQMIEILWEKSNVLKMEADLNQYFQILKDECQREMNLVNDLLDLSYLDAETEPLILTAIALQDWLPHLLESFTERIQQQQLQIQLDVPADLPTVITDLPYLERILSELLHNACKYTPQGERIEIQCQTIESLGDEKVEMDAPPKNTIPLPAISQPPEPKEVQSLPWLQIQVMNTGVEIPASECDRVFDKFYRIPSDDPWKHSGIGLGLALVKKLVQRLQGIIEVSSGQKQTTFTIQLPLQLS